MALREIFQGEGKLLGLLSVNVSLEGVHKVIHAVQPTLSAILLVLQIAVAAITLKHLIQKMLARRGYIKTEQPNEETES